MFGSISLISVANITGCSTTEAGPTSDYKAKFEKRVGANEQAADAFVDALSKLPFEQRRDYVIQHPSDARNLAKVPDQELQKRYQALLRAKTNP